jgi:hypothetical protein
MESESTQYPLEDQPEQQPPTEDDLAVERMDYEAGPIVDAEQS